MELMKYQLTMFKYGKYFLEQHFDDAALAIKQGRFFMSASDTDHAPRGYSVTESATGIRLMVEGVTAYEEGEQDGEQ